MITKSDQEKVGRSIELLAQELSTRTYTTTKNFPASDHGKKFEKIALRHARSVRKMAPDYDQRIRDAAQLIHLLHPKTDWLEQSTIRTLFYELAKALTSLSEHPKTHKRVASLIIDDNSNLISYGINGVPKEIPAHGSYYRKGTRSHCQLCAELQATANAVGLNGSKKDNTDLFSHEMHRMHRELKRQGLQTKTRDRIMAEHRIGLVSEYVDEVYRRLSHDVASHNRDMRMASLVSTVIPCIACADVVVSFGFRSVITSKNTGKNFTRDVREGLRLLQRAKISIHYV